MRRLVVLLVLSALALSLAATPVLAALNEVKVAGQFGLVYAPLMIGDKLNTFEKYGLKPVWKEYGSGAAVREALVSGEADVGFMGIPPFLIGWDNGCPWKAFAGFMVVPVALVTNRPEIKSLKDFKPGDKIAVPSPGSVQDILLAMAAERELGDPKAFEKNLVAMAHPDAAAALIAKKGIDAHFSTPPYLFEELSQPGMHLVVDDVKCFGKPFSFNVGVATKKFHDSRPVDYAAFAMALQEATAYLNENPRKAAELLADEFKLTPDKAYKYLTWPGVIYTTAPYGLMGFADFMKEAGYIKKVPARLSDIAWENVLAFVGERSGTRSMLDRLQYR